MYRFLLSVFGAGYSPFAPGTCGSAVGALVFLAAGLLGGTPMLIGLMAVLAVWGAMVTVVFGDKAIKELGHDPGLIVSDELCGQALTYLWLWPIARWSGGQFIIFAAAGFVLS